LEVTPFWQAVDRCPVQGVARRDDEGAITDRAAVFQRDLVAIRLEADDRPLDPAHARRDDGGLGAASVLHVEDAAPDHGPARLVVMGLARLDDDDVELAITLKQGCRRGQTRRSSADDDDVGPLGAGACRRGHRGFEPGTQSRQIISRLGRRRDQGVRRLRPGLGQGPERRGACARAAVGQHGAFQPQQGIGHAGDVGVADLTADRRHMGETHAMRGGQGLHLRRARLAGLFAVGSVVDDRAEALARCLGDVRLGQLGRDGQGGREGLERHGDRP